MKRVNNGLIKIIGCVLVNILAVGNVVALDMPVRGPTRMLSPKLSMGATAFLKQYLDLTDSLTGSISSGPVEAVNTLLAQSPDPDAREFEDKFERAFEFYCTAERNLDLYEQKGSLLFSGAITPLPNLLGNLDFEQAQKISRQEQKADLLYSGKERDGLRFNAQQAIIQGIALLESVDFNRLQKIIPKEKNETIYLGLTLTAELYFMTAARVLTNNADRAKNLIKAAGCLESAFALEGIEPDFQNVVLMARIQTLLVEAAAWPEDKKIEAAKQGLKRFEQAETLCDTLGKSEAATRMIADMQFLHFMAACTLGRVFQDTPYNYDASVAFREAYVLAENLTFSLNEAQEIELKKFYADAYQFFWVYGQWLFREKIPGQLKSLGEREKRGEISAEELEANRERLEKFGYGIYAIASICAQKYLERLLESEKTTKAYHVLLCCLDAETRIAEHEIVNGNPNGAQESLRDIARTLIELKKYPISDPRALYPISDMHFSLLTNVLLMLQIYGKQGELKKAGFDPAAFMDEQYFAGFLARFKEGRYKQLLDKIHAKPPANELAEAEMLRELYRYSELGRTVKEILKKTTEAAAALSSKEFSPVLKSQVRMGLVFANIMDNDYAQAKKYLLQVLQQPERFSKNPQFFELIFPQLLLEREKSRDFIAEILSNMYATGFCNALIENKDLLSKPMRTLLAEALNAHPRLIKDNSGLIGALGLDVAIPEDRAKTEEPVKKEKPPAVKVDRKTSEVLIMDVDRALSALSEVKKPKGKGNQGPKKINSKSPELRRFEKTLAALVSDYQQFESPMLGGYLRGIVNNEQVCANVWLVRTVINNLLKMDTDEALQLVKAFRDNQGSPVLKSMAGELQQTYARFEQEVRQSTARRQQEERIALRTREFNSRVDALSRQADAANDAVYAAESAARAASSALEDEFRKINDEFADVLQDAAAQQKRENLTRQVETVVSGLASRLEVMRREKITAYARTVAALIQEISGVWHQVQQGKTAPVETAFKIRGFIDSLPGLEAADPDIAAEPAVKEAAEDFASAKENFITQARQKNTENSRFCQQAVKFEFRDQGRQLAFIVVGDPTRKMKRQFREEALEITRLAAVISPQLDLENGIILEEPDGWKRGWFVPAMTEIRETIKNESGLFTIARACENYIGRFEKKAREIRGRELSELDRIKALSDVIHSDERYAEVDAEIVQYPQLDFDALTIPDSGERFLKEYLDNYDARYEALIQDLTGMLDGNFFVTVHGDFRELELKRLKEQPEVKAVEQKLRTLFSELMSRNPDPELVLTGNPAENSLWVQDILRIWDEESGKAVLNRTPLERTPARLPGRAEEIGRAI